MRDCTDPLLGVDYHLTNWNADKVEMFNAFTSFVFNTNIEGLKPLEP